MVGIGITIYLLHESNYHATYAIITNKWPEKHNITAKFIELSKLRDLEDMEEKAQIDSLKLFFDLDVQHIQPPTKPAITEIPHRALLRLRDIVMDIPGFKDGGSKGRRLVIAQAGLMTLADDYVFSDSHRDDAFRLVTHLMECGPPPEEPTQHALEIFINFLIKHIGDIGMKDKEFMRKLLENYEFS
jgi:hypothetical protein